MILENYRELLEEKRAWQKRRRNSTERKMKEIIYETQNNFIATGELKDWKNIYKRKRDDFLRLGGSLEMLQREQFPKTIREKKCPALYSKIGVIC